MDVHLARNGTWVTCTATERACPRDYHLPNMTPAAANNVPQEILLDLINAFAEPDMVDDHGDKLWIANVAVHGASTAIYRNGDMREVVLHRDFDLPAHIKLDGTMDWYQLGIRHRTHDRPAHVGPDGQEWYWHGKVHREDDKPALITADGGQAWYRHDMLHRGGDKPAMIYASGVMYWYQMNAKHRDGDLPAVEAPNGARQWFVKGKRHRMGGPAVIHAAGSGKAPEYWLYDKRCSETEAMRTSHEVAQLSFAERLDRQADPNFGRPGGRSFSH